MTASQVESGNVQVKSSQVKSSQVKSSQVKSSQVKSRLVKSSPVQSSQVKSSRDSIKYFREKKTPFIGNGSLGEEEEDPFIDSSIRYTISYSKEDYKSMSSWSRFTFE
eukprot:CAMPEP_0170904684 /NCGR_PEP_ID=MMETSP0734-20130129/50586_1 /TAXON_ID=186038 /ORGANISM="Fragilariopsis kerguelensis, Strain L26-C5" /LENGTH=107 /DNA_ID=CAMNT_0011300263 /DNA_START=179 /DNA_END=502 /DNA_ORIENTATION=-